MTVERIRYFIGLSNNYGVISHEKQQDLINIISKYYAGFTVYETKGYWNAIEEPSLVIEIIHTEGTKNNMHKLEPELKEWLKETQQAAVLRIIDYVIADIIEV